MERRNGNKGSQEEGKEENKNEGKGKTTEIKT